MSMSCVRTGASQSPQVAREEVRIVRRGLQRHDVIGLGVEHFRDLAIPGNRLRHRQSARQLDQVQIADGGEGPQGHRAGGRVKRRAMSRSCPGAKSDQQLVGHVGGGPADGGGRPEQREQDDGERPGKAEYHRCSPSRPEPGALSRDEAALEAPRSRRGVPQDRRASMARCRVPGATGGAVASRTAMSPAFVVVMGAVGVVRVTPEWLRRPAEVLGKPREYSGKQRGAATAQL